MISGFFITIFTLFVTFMLGLLPIAAFPSQISTSLAVVWGDVQAYSFFFPMTTLVAVLGSALLFHAVILLFSFIRWTIHLLRGN